MVQIVEAKQIHVSEILEIWKEMMDFHRERDPFFARRDEGHHDFKKYVKESIESQNSQVLVALDDKEVVAYSLSHIAQYPPVFKHRTYGSISDVAVERQYRRQGIGKFLLREIKKWFFQQGINRVEVRVSSRNEVACSFWSKHGFQEYIHIMYLDT